MRAAVWGNLLLLAVITLGTLPLGSDGNPFDDDETGDAIVCVTMSAADGDSLTFHSESVHSAPLLPALARADEWISPSPVLLPTFAPAPTGTLELLCRSNR
jgi:hypothetical protein